MYPGKHGQEIPDKPAYVMAESGRVVTYRELDERSNQCAWLFRELSLAAGDGIAIFMKNEVGFLETCWGAQRSGLYYTPVSTHLTPDEIEYIVKDCGAKVFIASHDLQAAAAPIAERSTGLQRCLSVGGAIPGFESFEAALEGLPTHRVPNEQEGSDILYSSGTTGRPKGIKVPLPSNEIGTAPVMLAAMLNGQYGLCPDTVYLSPAPLYHSAPLCFNMLIGRLGATSIILERFDAENALAAIEKHRVTLSQWVPSMFVRMLKLPEETRARYDVSSIEVAVHAAAPCPPAVKEAMIDWWGPVINEYYGSTEKGSVVFCTSEGWLAHRGTVGKPMSGVELRILDDDGNDQPVGIPGDVYCRITNGPDFTYNGDDEKRKRAEKMGLISPGDIGYLDEDGYLHLCDRRNDMVISGGVNIYPAEIENCLMSHPEIADCAVFGIPDEDFGEALCACIRAEDGAAIDDGDVQAHVRTHLAGYKVPKVVEFMDELPREDSGKIFKRKLKEPYWADQEKRI